MGNSRRYTVGTEESTNDQPTNWVNDAAHGTMSMGTDSTYCPDATVDRDVVSIK